MVTGHVSEYRAEEKMTTIGFALVHGGVRPGLWASSGSIHLPG